MRTYEVPTKRGLKERVKSKAGGRKTPARARSENAEFIQHLRGLSRWIAIIPLVILMIFICSELALAFGNTPEEVDTRSRITTDYSPWDFTLIRALNDGITGDIEDDLAKYGDGSENSFARLSDPVKSPGEFTIMIVETPDPPPAPTSIKVEMTPPTGDPIITESPTPTVDPETITPTPAFTATVTGSPTITATSTPRATATPSSTTTPTLTTVTPTSTSSATPNSPPPLCFEGGGWYAMHYHQPGGQYNYVGAEFHEGHGLPDGPMALSSVIIESVNLKQENVNSVESIEKVQVGWRNGTIQDIPWAGEANANVTIPIGIEMPLINPPIDHFYRATYVTFYLRGDIDGTYKVTLTIYIPQYSRRCTMTAGYSTE